MKRLLLIICVLGFAQYAYSQSIVWERLHDISTNGAVGTLDVINDILIQDTSTFITNNYCSKYRWLTSFGQVQRPTLFKYNSTGDIVDTLVINDTIYGFLSSLNRRSQTIWMYYRIQNLQYSRQAFHKINFRGFTLARKEYNSSMANFLDSLPTAFIKLIPINDGGFYLLGSRDRRIGTQSVEQWQVSRWDSLGNRKWVKEYLYTYAYGQPQQAEFLPNGNLFVSGWAGREIMALEIDTANGRAINRKVLYTHPNPRVGWNGATVQRAPHGYVIAAGTTASSGDSLLFNGFVNDSLRLTWSVYSSRINRYFITSMADSSFWYLKIVLGNPFPTAYNYEKMDKNFNVTHSVNLYTQNNINTKRITSVGFISDGSAIFGGEVTTATTSGSALYLCKIDSIGTPFNPVYPPVGPVPVATKSRIVEPDLQVFPNPFTHTLRISHKGTMQLLDIHGRKVMAQAVEAGQEINTSSLPRGMYLLRFTSTAGKGYVRKVVRE